ncbi:MAG: hypothetical protein JWM33_4011 [Caulobacteraceae bacterium]|nr:hypothetical protein [Caulobacteraceae bacterium]
MRHHTVNLAIALTAAAALALGLGSFADAATTTTATAKAAPPATGARLPGCRDATGKFVPCPTAPPAKIQCRDKTTKKLAKCGAPNTERVPAKTSTATSAARAPMPN